MKMNPFVDYQRKIWLYLSYMALCRFYIVVDKHGNFIIKKVGKVRLFLYYALWLNSVIKISYLVLAYRGYLPVKVHFLDQMGMWDWFLCFSQLIQETNLWYRKYPLFEILCANWKIQEQVYAKLGFPTQVEAAILRNDHSLIRMHTSTISFGCAAFVVQFLMAVKYALNLYAIIPADNWILRIFFCAHEVVFIFHIWIHQAFSIILCELFASTYTHIMREMTAVLKHLIDLGILNTNHESIQKESNTWGEARLSLVSPHPTKLSTHGQVFRRKYIQKRILDPHVKAPGTDYNIMTLLQDYQKLVLATNTFNSWVGQLMGGTMGSNYSQFVSDVFMVFQLLQEPETDTLAVFFYIEDACAGMLILFRMLMIISRLYPASEEFLHVLRQYVTYDTPVKNYLLKYQKCLRIIASKLGGYKTKGDNVPKGVNALIKWYTAAAMWKRPVDRRT